MNDTARLAAIAAAAREVDNAFHGLRPAGLTDRQDLALDRLEHVFRDRPPARSGGAAMHRLLILLLPLALAGCATPSLRLLCYHGEVVGQVDGFPVSGDGSVRGLRVDADPETLSRVTASVDGETCKAEVRAP